MKDKVYHTVEVLCFQDGVKYKQKLPDLTRNCKQCGIEFIASNKSQEYCSLDCKHTIPCEICGKLFVAKAGTTCSVECSEFKRKKTCLERFDAENALQNPAIIAGGFKYF